MKGVRAGLACILMLALLGAVKVSAAIPPPPPTPPSCPAPCGGPPPPPTPIPTAGPGTLPNPTVVVALSVRVEPSHVHRGHTMKLLVTSQKGDVVHATVRYKHDKPLVFVGKVPESGTLTKSWKVPQNAAIGKGTVTVTIKTSTKPYKVTLSFTVLP